jgi:hypothetical protein
MSNAEHQARHRAKVRAQREAEREARGETPAPSTARADAERIAALEREVAELRGRLTQAQRAPNAAQIEASIRRQLQQENNSRIDAEVAKRLREHPPAPSSEADAERIAALEKRNADLEKRNKDLRAAMKRTTEAAAVLRGAGKILDHRQYTRLLKFFHPDARKALSDADLNAGFRLFTETVGAKDKKTGEMLHVRSKQETEAFAARAAEYERMDRHMRETMATRHAAEQERAAQRAARKAKRS